MGQIINHKCNSCNYEFSQEDKEFYFNKDLSELKESIQLFSTFKQIAESPISGNVYTTYCDDCEEFIKTYEVIKNETNLSESEIEKLILKDDNSKKVVITTTKSEINCPECGKTLQKQLTDGSACPECKKGKLICESVRLTD